jgi:hypothetical protein
MQDNIPLLLSIDNFAGDFMVGKFKLAGASENPKGE